MMIQDLAAVLIRLLSVVLVIYGLHHLSTALAYTSLPATFGLLTMVAPAVAAFVLGVVLWALPGPIAGVVVPQSIRSKNLEGLDAAALEQAGLGLLGVYILSWAIPDLVLHAAILWQVSELSPPAGIYQMKLNIVVTCMELAIGLFMALRARGIHAAISRLRNAGA